MIQKLKIPRKSIYRYSLYSRCLQRLRQNDIDTVSSDTLARAAGVKPAQLRKDLTYLGNFGRRGLGYNVVELQDCINRTMGTNKLTPVVLVGVGNLGAALLAYRGFEKEGFEIVGAFDVDAEAGRNKGLDIDVLPIDTLPQFILAQQIKMAILAVPASAAQEVANQLVLCGIQGILNFSPILLDVPEPVVSNNVNLAIELENLAYFIRT